MKFHTDNFFHIGAMHVQHGEPCQDYALSGEWGDRAFAVVSDGCSRGGMTDVGARFMALSLAKAFDDECSVDSTPDFEELEEGQWKRVRESQELYALLRDDMLATCIYAYLSPQHGAIRVMGDGAAALVRKDGSLVLYRFEWRHPDQSLPFYPIYLYEGLANFLDAYGVNENAFVVERWEKDGAGTWCLAASESTDAREGIKGATVHLSKEEIESLTFVAVFTDGVFQVEGVDWKDAMSQLLAFKTTTGVFAKRRMIRFIEDAKKIGKGPQDDLSFAVINVDRAEA